MSNASLVLRALVIAGLLLAGAGSGGCAGASTSPDADAQRPEPQAVQIGRAGDLVKEAQRLEVSGKNAEAIAKYQEAIGAFRELPVAWNNMGRLLMKMGENLQAADAFATAAELSPTDPRPMYNLGALWEDLGYLDDAQKWYDQALDRDDQYLPALRRRVLVDQMRDRADEKTFEYCKTALLLEKDPWWIDRLKRAELRLRQLENLPIPSPDRARTAESVPN